MWLLKDRLGPQFAHPVSAPCASSPCTPTALAQRGVRFLNSTSRQGKPLSLFLDVLADLVVDVGLSCRAQRAQRAPFVHPGVTYHLHQHLHHSSEGRDFTYLLPEFLGLFVLFSSSEEEEEEGGASTRTGPATSEPQRQKPFPCSINFIGKAVSLGGGLLVAVHFCAPRVRHREKGSLIAGSWLGWILPGRAGRGDTP